MELSVAEVKEEECKRQQQQHHHHHHHQQQQQQQQQAEVENGQAKRQRTEKQPGQPTAGASGAASSSSATGKMCVSMGHTSFSAASVSPPGVGGPFTVNGAIKLETMVGGGGSAGAVAVSGGKGQSSWRPPAVQQMGAASAASAARVAGGGRGDGGGEGSARSRGSSVAQAAGAGGGGGGGGTGGVGDEEDEEETEDGVTAGTVPDTSITKEMQRRKDQEARVASCVRDAERLLLELAVVKGFKATSLLAVFDKLDELMQPLSLPVRGECSGGVTAQEVAEISLIGA